MAKNKRPSPVREVSEAFKEQLRIGESKHEAKAEEGTSHPEGIFSFSTYHNYVNCAARFYKWARAEHGCKTLDEAKQYAAEYIEMRSNSLNSRGEALSAWTLKRDASAIAKLYNCSTADLGIETKSRYRADITRSRGAKAHDSHFSESKNIDIIKFCRGCGLRRCELEHLKGKDVYEKGGKTFVHVADGKGGKEREVFVLPEYSEHIRDMAEKVKPDEKIFKKGDLKNRMDIHSYRHWYANSLYQRLARPKSEIPKKEQYRCKRDKSGTVYDKRAMRRVTENLGHNRISVIAGSYLD